MILDVYSPDTSNPSIDGHRGAERLNSEIHCIVVGLVGRLTCSHTHTHTPHYPRLQRQREAKTDVNSNRGREHLTVAVAFAGVG